MLAGTASLSDSSTLRETFLRRRRHSRDLPSAEKSEELSTCPPKNLDQWISFLYPYSFKTSNWMLETLGELYTSSVYEWDSRAVQPVSVLSSPRHAFSVGSHSCVEINVKCTPNDVVEVCTKGDFARKKVAVRPFGPQTHRREKAWLTIFQAN